MLSCAYRAVPSRALCLLVCLFACASHQLDIARLSRSVCVHDILNSHDWHGAVADQWSSQRIITRINDSLQRRGYLVWIE
jgi:hypothetical protein